MDLKKRAEDMREFFNRKAAEDAYDCVHLKMMNSKEPITRLLPDGTKRVLDLGAGTGLELVPLFERFPDAHVTVVDVAEEMLKQLKERPFADHIEIICGDFFFADFGSGYDAVISTSALHHFEEGDKERLYQKAFDSLRSGGVIINSDKCAESQEHQEECFRVLAEEPGKYSHMDTPLTVENECKLLKNAGFADVTAVRIPDTEYAVMSGKKM